MDVSFVYLALVLWARPLGQIYQLCIVWFQAFKVAAELSGRAFRCLVRRVRCEGHMLHVTASISLTRAAVVPACYSSTILLRSYDHALVLRNGVYFLVDAELDFDDSGSTEQTDEDTQTDRQTDRQTW